MGNGLQGAIVDFLGVANYEFVPYYWWNLLFWQIAVRGGANWVFNYKGSDFVSSDSTHVLEPVKGLKIYYLGQEFSVKIKLGKINA